MPPISSPKQNHLLAALPSADYARLLPHLDLFPMRLGCALYEAGTESSHVYFPTTSIVSLLSVMKDGSSSALAVTGNEGLVGVTIFMGGESTISRAVVQSAGHGYRLGATLSKREFALGGNLHLLTLRFMQALIAQMSQSAACNRHHSLNQQLCRWLLVCFDRLEHTTWYDSGVDLPNARCSP